MKAIFAIALSKWIMVKIKTAAFLPISILGLLLAGILLGFHSCTPDPSPRIPDVTNIDMAVELNRFEQDLFSLDTGAVFEQQLETLETKYGEFARVYFNYILGSKDPELTPQGHEAFIRGFISYPPVRNLFDTTQILFGDLNRYQASLNQAFQFYNYYFPDRSIPSVTTYISEFGLQSFIYADDNLGIGLDFFLGETFPYRNIDPVNPNFSSYLTRTYNQEHLTVKTLQPLVQELTGNPGGERMLDVMIQKGKQLFLLDRLLPFTSDTIIMEVSNSQWQWLQENELEIWAYFLNEKDKSSTQSLLYSTEWATYRKYVEYSPNSPGMPKEAPGRTACFVGWKIIEAYAQRQKLDENLDLLLLETDAQKILEESRYKPARR